MIGLSDNNSKQKGYTLIELLLVLTVLALIAALAVKTYRDKALSDRINIASLNIQHILEAGMSYNVAKNGFWPEKNWNPCNSGSTVKDQTFVTDYLPNESNQSNFGGPLCWSGDDPNDPKLTQQGKRFWVALKVGNDSDSTNTAQRIAARLPNAIITNNPDTECSSPNNCNTCTAGQDCYVRAVVSVPSASTNNNQLTISALGYCNPNLGQAPQPGTGAGSFCQRTSLADQFGTSLSGDSLGQYKVSFQCKPNEVPKIYVTPDFLREARSPAGVNFPVDPAYETAGASEQGQSDSEFSPSSCPAVTDQSGIATCTINMKATYDAQAGITPADLGCTTSLQQQGLCNCPVVDSSSGRQQCPSGNDSYLAGTIGASYVAACAVRTTTNLTENIAHW